MRACVRCGKCQQKHLVVNLKESTHLGQPSKTRCHHPRGQGLSLQELGEVLFGEVEDERKLRGCCALDLRDEKAEEGIAREEMLVVER